MYCLESILTLFLKTPYISLGTRYNKYISILPVSKRRVKLIRQNLLEELSAGCSALSWSTLDQKHFWGRNLDFNRLAAETKVTYVPRGTEYCFYGTSLENSENPQCKTTSLYASLGTGLLTEGCSPILYEGINEKGLMGGQLYYRGFAHFEDQVRPGTLPLQPPFLVYHMLSQCSSVDEVVTMLQNNLTLLNIPLFGTVPTLSLIHIFKIALSILRYFFFGATPRSLLIKSPVMAIPPIT